MNRQVTERIVWIYDDNWDNRVIEPIEAKEVNNGRNVIYYTKLKRGNGYSSKATSSSFRGSWRHNNVRVFETEVECKKAFEATCRKKIKNLTMEIDTIKDRIKRIKYGGK